MNVFTFSLIGQILLSALLLWALWHSTSKGSKWRRAGLIFVGGELALFLMAYFIRHSVDLATLKAILNIFNGYYIALIFLLSLLYMGYLLVAIAQWLKWLPSKEQRIRMRGGSLLYSSLSHSLLCIVGIGIRWTLR